MQLTFTEHTHTHTHGCQQTDEHNAKSKCESHHQLAIKQDRACSTKIGAFLQGQAHRIVQLTYDLQEKEGQLCLKQNRHVTRRRHFSSTVAQRLKAGRARMHHVTYTCDLSASYSGCS